MVEEMAASSGGIEWSSILRPLLTQRYDTANKTEIIELCSTLVKCETEILRRKENNTNFYNNVVILSADFICSCAKKLSVSHIDTVSAACRVLLKYLITWLQTLTSESSQNSSQIEKCLNAVRVLCIGGSPLSSAEVSLLVNAMKGENLAQHTNTPPQEKESGNKQESFRARTDLSMDIFEQLSLPLRDTTPLEHNFSIAGNGGASGTTPTGTGAGGAAPPTSPPVESVSPTGTNPKLEINKLLLKTNLESLQALRAGDTVLDLCLSLPSIKKSRSKVEEALAGKPFSVPTSQAEATALKNCVSANIADIKLALSAINLPVLEPLTPSKLDKLCALSMAVLYIALNQAAANSLLTNASVSQKGPPTPQVAHQQQITTKDEHHYSHHDHDTNAIALVEESLKMYTFIGTLIKNSTRAGGHVYQNHLLAGAWVLISGLEAHLMSSVAVLGEKQQCPNTAVQTSVQQITTQLDKDDVKGKSPCKSRDNPSAAGGGSGISRLTRTTHFFGILSVAIASKALSLLTVLFEDLHLEACSTTGSIGQIEPAPLAIMGQFTALQRVAKVLSAAPMNNFLFYLALVSYSKASTLKRFDPPEGDTFSQSDSSTCYDDINVSDESSIDDDDDSEQILGQWFEDTLAPPETATDAATNTSNTTNTNKTGSDNTKSGQLDGTYQIVPETKFEAQGHIRLATNVFIFLNKHFLCTKSAFVTRYVKAGLTEHQMIILAVIIRDLDRESSRTDNGVISSHYGAALGVLYCDFSAALSKFTHNLVTSNNVSSLQTCLLNHLGVSPWNTDTAHAWPLQVYSRTLAVLTQVLVLRRQNEKEASVICIWHRLVNTLIENVINAPQHSSVESGNEDLNVEHAQVLIYLFHSLNLMQKKSVLLLLAGGILRCSEVARSNLKDFQLLHISKILLLFDYIMKHLYDAPTSLLEQIQWNLFYSSKLNGSDGCENMNRKFTPWQEIEENYRKVLTVSDSNMRPRFYMLTTLEMNNQEIPKLDGLACNFILGTQEKLSYPLLLNALIEILNVTHITSGQKMSFLGLCSTQYCFTICWRLLQMLPPSVFYLERLASNEVLQAGPLLLHSLIWGPRTGHKTFNRWLKECTLKQGLYIHHTENLLKSVSDMLNNMNYDVNNAKNCIVALIPEVTKSGGFSKESLPPLWHLCLLDCLLAKVQIGFETANSADVSANCAFIQDLFPHVLKLTQTILQCTRWSMMHGIVEKGDESAEKSRDFDRIQDVLAISSNKNTLIHNLSAELIGSLPHNILTVVQGWNKTILEQPSAGLYQNDIIPSESFILKIVETYVSTLSASTPFNIDLSLRLFLQNCVKFICDHAHRTENTDTKNKAIEMLVSLTLDVRTEYLHDAVSNTLDKMIGDIETDEHQKRVNLQVLHHTYRLLINYTPTIQSTDSDGTNDQICFTLNEQVLHNCLLFYEKILEKSAGRQALETFFSGDKDLVNVLLSVANPQMSTQYCTRVLQFFNKLFQAAEKSSTDPSLNYLCNSMSRLANVEIEKLQNWLRIIISGHNTTENPNSTKDSGDKSSNKWSLTTPTNTNTSTGNNNNSTATAGTSKTQNQEASATPTENIQQNKNSQENTQLLQSLTSFIVKQSKSEEVALTLLKAIIPLGGAILSPTNTVTSSTNEDGISFANLMRVMVMLADAGTGRGHVYLFPATGDWIEKCNKYLKEKDVLEKVSSSHGSSSSGNNKTDFVNNHAIFEVGCCIMEYISDVVAGISSLGGTTHSHNQTRSISPAWDGEGVCEIDPELQLQDEQLLLNTTNNANNEDEDSGGEDSDEDSLSNKLCTFTITQKDFMNQHWYHCHTCRMLDGVGVCSICARVCHRGHDLTYAKYGNFFCDCGAKEDGSCQALQKRTTAISNSQDSSAAAAMQSGQPLVTQEVSAQNLEIDQKFSMLRRRTSSPVYATKHNKTGIVLSGGAAAAVTSGGSSANSGGNSGRMNNTSGVKQLNQCKEWIVNYLGTSSLVDVLIEFVDALMVPIEMCCNQHSPVGSYLRAIKALQRLHANDKKFEYTDQLMVTSIGTPEGSFENVRMNYTGEQGQNIRQLFSAHVIRRVAMCCMISTQGRRQHLAVAHEKGKISILQLSSLFKLTDTTTRKITVNKLSSAPIPFTVLSLASNQCNEDFLAVCGLKDCHVLTVASTGAVQNHLVLHPQLETGNFIIKAIWLPGSQVQLALVTADFVKIYDLSKDALSPHYYFLVPSGKIRDCTFIYEDGIYQILLMSSPGYIYTEMLIDDTSAKHGSFYVTNTLEVLHLDVTDVNGTVAGGGVSIYYSHTLGLLFYSYAHGKSFISPITSSTNCLSTVFPITLSSSSTTSSNNTSNNGNSTTSSTTPGSSSTNGSAGIGGSKPNGAAKNIAAQPLCQWTEIPNHPGLVYCAMQSSNNPVVLMLKPDTILIQEMKIVPPKAKITDMVAVRHCSGSEVKTTMLLLCEDGSLRLNVANMEQTGFWLSSSIQSSITNTVLRPKKKKIVKTGKTSASVTFPVDFFEHCQPIDFEVIGNEFLQLYSSAQIKTRLSNSGQWLTCARQLGFDLEIINPDSSMVIVGVRICVGGNMPSRAPTYVEIFGRMISFNALRSRWYDIPLTRDESLLADKKIHLVFGQSQDPDAITIIDSIKVYGKSKELFGWPEETEENVQQQSTSQSQTFNNATVSISEQEVVDNIDLSLNKLEKLVVGVLEALDSAYFLYPLEEKYKQSTLKIATQLITIPTSPIIQIHAKSLLSQLHTSRQMYHNYKDQALLKHVLVSLNAMINTSDIKEIDAESFYRLIMIVRGIAVARPQNLVKFSDSVTSIQDVVLDDPLDRKTKQKSSTNHQTEQQQQQPQQHILLSLMDVLWVLHSLNPENLSLVPVVKPGLRHTEHVIHALVEIVHAFNSCDTYSNITVAVYLQLLLCEDTQIAFSAMQALVKVLKPKVKRRKIYPNVVPKMKIEEETSTATATPKEESQKTTASASTSRLNYRELQQHEHHQQQQESAIAAATDAAIEMILGNAAAAGVVGVGAGGGVGPSGAAYQPLLELPADADDETMVELAIALSLQEHGENAEEEDEDVDDDEDEEEEEDNEEDDDEDEGENNGNVREVEVIVQDNGGINGEALLRRAAELREQEQHQQQQQQESGQLSDATVSPGCSDDDEITVQPTQKSDTQSSRASGESAIVDTNRSKKPDDFSIGAKLDDIKEVDDTSTISSAPGTSGAEKDGEQYFVPDSSDISDPDNSSRLHILRLQLLERLTEYLPRLRNVSGVRVIPFLQVVLHLTNDLDGHLERDRACFNSLLAAILEEFQLDQTNNVDDILERTNTKEVKLILLKLLSVFMNRAKSSTTSTSSNSKQLQSTSDNPTFVSKTTATVLHKANMIAYCYQLLKALLPHWKETTTLTGDRSTTITSSATASTAPNHSNSGSASSSASPTTTNALLGCLLKEHMRHSSPDMMPFFTKQLVKENGPNFFDTAYPEVLTEIALRMPYQVHRHSEISESIKVAFNKGWYTYLCRYMMTTQSMTLKRQVRKLLLFICGSKEKYRLQRDTFAINTHMKAISDSVSRVYLVVTPGSTGTMSYDGLVDLIEHLRACGEIAVNRTGNWQRYCVTHPDTIPFLIRMSCVVEEGVTSHILHLLQCAITNNNGRKNAEHKSSSHQSTATTSHQQVPAGQTPVVPPRREQREKSDDSTTTDTLFEETSCAALVEQINKNVDRCVLKEFVRMFLMETNVASVRWQVHSLLQAVYKNSHLKEREGLIALMWDLWPGSIHYGRKTSQFVDLLGYFLLMYHKSNSALPLPNIVHHVNTTIAMLEEQNAILARHPNTYLYAHMGQFIEMDGYYLESDPCLVCNNPEVAYTTWKLGSLKVDMKFTTTTQIVKLLSSYTISKITLRIGDLKRTKMVRTINIYYNNRCVQAVVELKNKPALWHKAKKITVQSGQTEVKIDFPLPIVACNLMIEYLDFYENIQASSETLQCPRCNAAVPSNPGVCANCGENVFQCHKCRAINYDEKDPFLCHSCGFCKYAKFDFTLLAKTCCAIEPIENDEDRKKTVSNINALLEKADRIYKQILTNRPNLEALMARITENRTERKMDEPHTTAANPSSVTQSNYYPPIIAGGITGSGGGGGGGAPIPSSSSSSNGTGVISAPTVISGNNAVINSGATPSSVGGLQLSSTGGIVLGGSGSGGGSGSTGVSGSGGGNVASTSVVVSGTSGVTAAAIGSQMKINRTIQSLAQQYCNDCKAWYDELSKIIQMVLVSRKELVAYDKKHSEAEEKYTGNYRHRKEIFYSGNISNSHCYGCASAVTEQCLTLLRVLAVIQTTRDLLCKKGLIEELVRNNLRVCSVQIQDEVKKLLCLLTKDNHQATSTLCSLIWNRITINMNGQLNSTDLGASVRHEVSLLMVMVQNEDKCWELKLHCMMKLFMKACQDSHNPLVMETIILPCLKICQDYMKRESTSKKFKYSQDKRLQFRHMPGLTVDFAKFLYSREDNRLEKWRKKYPMVAESSGEIPTTKEGVRAYYLSERYGKRWLRKVRHTTESTVPVQFSANCWFKNILFNTSSRLARQVAANIIEMICSNSSRRFQYLILMSYYLVEVHRVGECSAQFLALFHNLIRETPFKQYMTSKGILMVIAKMIMTEIEHLHYLETTTLTSDLTQGFALNQLTELLSSFLDDALIRRQYKSRLVGAILNGYLSLRRLVVQRTRLIDDTQEKLLELLEELTTGTEEEIKSFMGVCIQTVEKYNMQDILTPVFIFERLCSIIYPEEDDVIDFFLTLDKDPQQEDFLQGRMLGNPYSSTEPGLGPLMRNVKNKICQDCELVALLEDDNGMELLVNNKIISLDLPVKEVYKKIWVAEGGDLDSMRIVYRMRGLLGDATEEFIETLNNNSQSTVDNEEVYKMANVLADCGGLDVMVKRLGAIQNVWKAKPLLQVLLKLFRLSIKVNRCLEILIKPHLGAMGVFLRTLQMCLEGKPNSSQATVTEQLLDIMETVLSKATSQTLEEFKTFSLTFGGPEYITALLTCITHQSVRTNKSVSIHLTRVLTALVYGNEKKMQILLDHFKDILDLNKYDTEHTADDQHKLEMFCVLVDGIERNAIGNTLKDYIISLGVVKEYLEYITMHAPNVAPTLLRTDSDDLKEFISKPGLKYCLRFLTGLAYGHENTQIAVASAQTIPIIHRLEQVSSDEHVGSLAENLLEALCTNADVAKRIEEVREFTRSEKKRLAMAMREKQLGQLGMRTNDKGQVTAKSAILQQIEELAEETGLVCCICREGYKYQPTKVLGMYTFTKRCNVDEFETKARRTPGYTTVTHFNIVHIDCHMSAVRLARVRDEWASAALQNANTKCNGLLPLWGPQVPESAFASCLARNNTYLQESTNHRDIGHASTIQDLKLLLLKFAMEKPFHEDTGGGGPQSNMNMVPYLIHIALYVINTTRVAKREEANLSAYLKCTNMEKWIESAYEAEGPLYWATMSILIHSDTQWRTNRLTHLNRLVILAHMRHCHPSGPVKTVCDKSVKDFTVYKPYLMFFALVDSIYDFFFDNVSGLDELWANNLADYIRHNDETLLKMSEKLLTNFTVQLLPCTSLLEFCDVTGLLDDIQNPDVYISDLLEELS